MPQKPSFPTKTTKYLTTPNVISTTKQILSSVNTKQNSITNFLDKTTETSSIDETTNADDFESILKEFIFSELGIAFMAIIACLIFVVIFLIIWRCCCIKKRKRKKVNNAVSAVQSSTIKAKQKLQKTQPSADIHKNKNICSNNIVDDNYFDFPLTHYPSLPSSLLTNSGRASVGASTNKKSMLRQSLNKRSKEDRRSTL
ncbi:hypothetical protein ACQ4LE_004023 [Meloidogyne hapla]|uniref:Uncharacterized protein n=1 Tax=Meloidogyne hapla TaxID=6305 RepID=A0A1I8B0H3_MELHA